MLIELSRLLKRLGFSPAWKGYDYVIFAVMKVNENPSLIHTICRGLYPLIASYYDVSVVSVEKCIRSSIESAWVKADGFLCEELFQYSISAEKGKPTNAQFIATIAEHHRFI